MVSSESKMAGDTEENPGERCGYIRVMME